MDKKAKKRVNIVSTKLVRESSVLYENRTISSPEHAVNLVKTFIEDADREHFVIICLNIKNSPTSIYTVSIGSISASIVHPRECFKVAVMTSASSIILCHNHPSGFPEPSSEDIETTRRLVSAGDILGIKVIDHIIIGDGKWISFKERDLI